MTLYFHIGRDNHHFQAIDLLEFKGLGVSGTGHTGKLVVETEIILEGGGGQCLALLLDIQSLFGFNGLMQTLGEATTGHGAAGVLIDKHRLVVLYYIFDIPLK